MVIVDGLVVGYCDCDYLLAFGVFVFGIDMCYLFGCMIWLV